MSSQRDINQRLKEAGLKRCSVCKAVKPIKEFRIKKDRGYITRQYLCSDCQSERDKKYKKENEEHFKRLQKIYHQTHYKGSTREIMNEETRKRIKREKAKMHYYNGYREKRKKRPYDKEYQQKYREKHRDQLRKSHCIRNKRRRDYCSDQYVKKQIKKTYGIKYCDIPYDLIESRRAQILTKRLFNQKFKRNENTKTSKSEISLSLMG